MIGRCAVLHSVGRRASLRWVMTFAERKILLLAAWVATVATAGIILAIRRPDLWMFVACVALVPAAIANWLWDAPDATLVPVTVVARERS